MNLQHENISKLKATGSVRTMKRSGRPRKTGEKDDLRLYNFARANPKLQSPELNTLWKEKTGIEVSSRTVRLRLNERGLKNHIARKKPLLTGDQQRKRQVGNGPQRLDPR